MGWLCWQLLVRFGWLLWSLICSGCGGWVAVVAFPGPLHLGPEDLQNTCDQPLVGT